MTVDELLRYPWTWQGPFRVREHDDQHWEGRVAELPGFFVAGETREEVLREARGALGAYLESYLDSGDQLPFTSAWATDILGGGPIALNLGTTQQFPEQDPELTFA